MKGNAKEEKERVYKSSVVLMVFVIVVPCILCLLLLVPEMHYISRLDELIKRGAVIDATEISLIETGLSILGIAVSVWIGLNIYNVMKKSEINDKIKKLQKTNEQLAYEYERKRFLLELEKTKNKYEIAIYFIERFEVDTTIPIENFSRMEVFEKSFEECCKAYEQKQFQICNEQANNLLKAVEFEKNRIKSVKGEENSPEMEYFSVRYSDIIFYLYRTDKKSVSKDKFIESIQIYENILTKNKDAFGDNVKRYVQNTIAYSYFLLLSNEKNEPSNIVEEWKEGAEENFKDAIKGSNKGRYYQNYGCYLEKIRGNYEEAEKLYQMALKSDDVDNKNWNLLGSLYLKIFDRNVGINNRFMNGKTLSDEWKGIRANDLELLHRAYSFLYMALTKSPELPDVYYNFAKANLYLWLFEKKHNKKRSKREIAREYLRIAEVSVEDNKTGYLYTLRNYYEATGKYNQAIKINKKLLKNGAKGDTQEAKRLYELKRNNSETVK